jgi:hypothetical protein
MDYTVNNYEDLFLERVSDTREQQAAALKCKDIIKYKTKTIVSGPMLECEIYPIWRTSKKSIREKTRKESRKAQKNLNNKNTVKRVIRLINTNFNNNGIWGTFTYSNDKLPSSEEQARKDIQNYIRRLKRYIEREELESLKYIYVTEYSEGKRVHHHIVMNLNNRDIAEKLWKNGGRTQTRRLQPDDYGLEGMARYITKQKKDSKRYACSRNLKQPKVYEAYSKFTKRRAEKLALDENGAKEVFEKMYKNYVFNDIDIKYSEFVSGCYIYARMRNYMGDKNDKAKITRVFMAEEKHRTA